MLYLVVLRVGFSLPLSEMTCVASDFFFKLFFFECVAACPQKSAGGEEPFQTHSGSRLVDLTVEVWTHSD